MPAWRIRVAKKRRSNFTGRISNGLARFAADVVEGAV
jgi:hypothetical protein